MQLTRIVGFGLATLQLEELEKVDEPEDVPDVLKNLPPSYKAALEETLDKISRNIKKKEEIKAYKTLLSWVAQEYTPFFSISQLRVIIGLKTTYQSFNIRENVNTTFARWVISIILARVWKFVCASPSFPSTDSNYKT